MSFPDIKPAFLIPRLYANKKYFCKGIRCQIIKPGQQNRARSMEINFPYFEIKAL